jgi:hypothetical protein
MILSCKKKLFLLVALVTLSISQVMARDHLIYSVAEDLPMGFDNEVLRKNYYINMGSQQGLQKGTTLNVFRVISKANPYNDKKRVNYSVKVGELEVLHTEDGSAITIMKSIANGSKDPLFDINAFMIGDKVSVAIK